ncbi:MAG: hypothetical protein ACJ749_11815, partial [Flavisolibacter sp.]
GPDRLNLPEGSWVIGKKYFDKKEWVELKSGKRNGFSVEGLFDLIPAQFAAEKVNPFHTNKERVMDKKLDDLVEMVYQILSDSHI